MLLCRSEQIRKEFFYNSHEPLANVDFIGFEYSFQVSGSDNGGGGSYNGGHFTLSA